MSVSDDRGETLVELLVTIMVVAIGLVGVMGALGSSILTSSAHRSQSTSQTVADQFSELINAKAQARVTKDPNTGVYDMTPCPTTAEMTPSGPFPWTAEGWAASIDHVWYWTPAPLPGPNEEPNQAGTWLDGNDAAQTELCRQYVRDHCPLAQPGGSLRNDPGVLPYCDPGLVRAEIVVTNDCANSNITGCVSDARAETRKAFVVVRTGNETGVS